MNTDTLYLSGLKKLDVITFKLGKSLNYNVFILGGLIDTQKSLSSHSSYFVGIAKNVVMECSWNLTWRNVTWFREEIEKFLVLKLCQAGLKDPCGASLTACLMTGDRSAGW